MPPRAYKIKFKFFNLVFSYIQPGVSIFVTFHFPLVHIPHVPVTPSSSTIKT